MQPKKYYDTDGPRNGGYLGATCAHNYVQKDANWKSCTHCGMLAPLFTPSADPGQSGGEQQHQLRAFGSEQWHNVHKDDYDSCTDESRKRILPPQPQEGEADRKTDEIIGRFMELTGRHDRQITDTPNPSAAFSHAKDCALICVDEILNEFPQGYHGNFEERRKQFWQQVRHNILNR